MIRENIQNFKGLDHDPEFRWRGQSVTRIENLSDIAFAISLGMIISSVDAPKTFDELREFLFFLIPTGAAFAVMFQIWMSHYTFFRRYGVADSFIVGLNTILIFVILYLAYPLWFTFSSLYSWIMGQTTGDYSYALEMGMTGTASVYTICLFALAYAACLCILSLMQGHALRKRELLQLNPHEHIRTKETHIGLWWSTCLALAVVPLALMTWLGPFAAFLLFFQKPGFWAARYFLSKQTVS